MGSVFTALLLAACGGEPEDVPVDDGRSAEGEVLGGSISDEMIPLDQLRSQSPPLRDEPVAGDSAPSTAAGEAAPADAGAADPAAEEPQPEAAAEDG